MEFYAESSNISDNQLLLPNGNVITFNEMQYEGILKIKKWLGDYNNQFFTLAGYAGTGKSTIVKKILDKYKLRHNVVVSAPTHKAKKVVSNTTGINGLTLQSLLGLRPDINLDDFNPNDPQFNQIAIPKIDEYDLVVIDEASMINSDLYELIKNTVANINTKILFIGDPAQIPPVNEKKSIIFYDNTIQTHWLTKIERQTNTNPLSLIYDNLRNNLDKINGGFVRKTVMNELGEGVVFTKNKKEFRNIVIDKFNSLEFKRDSDFCKVIAWRNETVNSSNKIIRNELFGKNSDIIEIGDILMGYRNVSHESQWYNIIENSADYVVVKKSKLEENEYGIKGFNVQLRENLSSDQYQYTDVFIVDINDYDNLHQYAEMHDFFRDIGKSNKKLWSKYYKFRRDNLIMTTINKYRDGSYRESYNVIVKDLDYGFAITAHKSQGSTYSHVFIMENDINLNRQLKERNQIKYVAFTRPRMSAIVLTDVNDN